MDAADVIVVGSGPSGAHAAAEALRLGLRVLMLDVGVDEPEMRSRVPSGSFSEVRRTDPGQRAYFLGDGAVVDDADGPHLTPPRDYVTRDAATRQPVISDTFFPVQSLALGGLGAAWGAGSVTFEPFELERAGLPAEQLAHYYEAVIREIGVSGSAEDDISPYVSRIPGLQPPARIDSNARAILAAYAHQRALLHREGFSLGRPPLALLTEPLAGDDSRHANPYTDMDFYGDSNRSIYRPRFTIDAIRRNPRFQYVANALVRGFAEEPDRVRVSFTDGAGQVQSLEARRLILAAGAINSARIVLRSRNLTGVRIPLLCNPMSYLIAINLNMLGRPADERRHSLAQLLAVHAPGHRSGERVAASMYSYRSLLNFRLVEQLPFPTSLGLLAARTLATSLTIVGAHHPERPSPRKWLALDDTSTGALRAHYELDDDERHDVRRDLSALERCLRRIGCVTVRRMETPAGASIHYAGTIPNDPNQDAKTRSDHRGRLAGTTRVYLADASTWTSLPAKGLTLTLMANARRIAAEVAADARNEAP